MRILTVATLAAAGLLTFGMAFYCWAAERSTPKVLECNFVETASSSDSADYQITIRNVHSENIKILGVGPHC